MEIPGYREAVEKETTAREASYLGVSELVCGVPLLPLTPRRFLILDIVGSPFVSGGNPTAADIALFLWACSPDYNPEKPSKFRRWLFIRRCRKLIVKDAVDGIRQYVTDALQDAPGSSGQSGPASTSWISSIVDSLAREYGWSEAHILDMPLKRVFQYFRVITRRNNPKANFFNPSDRVRGDWLRKINEETEKN